MNITILEKRQCTGCFTCENICPHEAIVMLPNEEGFLYPEINSELCVDCGVCVKKCPQLSNCNINDSSANHDNYIALSKLRKLSKTSASGGIFATLASGFFKAHSKVLVCGAAYEEGTVHHLLVQKESELYKLQNSKYAQSTIGDIYIQIRKKLKEGYKVLFSGTPCQVAGLKNFLGSNTDGLFTVDIVCHGVPSLKFLERDLALYSNEGKITDVKFRRKSIYSKSKSQFCLNFKVAGKEKAILSAHDPYYNLFMNGATFRESCYLCKYANLNRVGDISIGDCDSAGHYPYFHPNEATSVVMINNEKGRVLWNELSEYFDYANLDIKHEATINHQLDHPYERPEIRNSIYHDVLESPMEKVAKKYAKPDDWKSKLWNSFLYYLPNVITNKILKYLR